MQQLRNIIIFGLKTKYKIKYKLGYPGAYRCNILSTIRRSSRDLVFYLCL